MSVEHLFTLREGAFKRFVVGVYGPNVSLKMLASEKTFPASFYATHVKPPFTRAVVKSVFDRDTTAAAFFRQIRHGNREDNA